MGVDVILEDEEGGEIETLEDDGGYVSKLLTYVPATGSHCLAYIDEYGDTTFNPYQVKRLLVELDEIPKDALGAGTRQFLERLTDLAKKCLEEHYYLKFYGD